MINVRRLSKKALLFTIIVFFSCARPEGIEKSSLASFDDQYKEVMLTLTKSLIQAFGTNRDYTLERRKSFDDTQVYFKDSGYISYKSSSFQFTDPIKKFFLEGNLSSIYFDNEQQSFTMMLFRFQEGDRRVRLIISSDPKTKARLEGKNPLLIRGDRHYLVIDDY
ncbi:MAG: hypothetical protein EOP48_05960 [Sphingobacteriales bacterium]|nr:MAG: hypothetical protein EOP48_05960 [Sphingobacteriales bacterium]